MLPADLVVTDSLEAPTKRIETVAADGGVPEGLLAVDIGPRTIERFDARLETAKTIFWNGPMGVFEKEEFATGTHGDGGGGREGGRDVGRRRRRVGRGGERARGSPTASRHISTGGGASLEFISGETLPGIQALQPGRS